MQKVDLIIGIVIIKKKIGMTYEEIEEYKKKQL